jgi:cob(I)alamin adenosyltransferase
MVELNIIYTKTGDDGTTSLANNERINKTTPRIEALGTVDEVNAHLGLAVSLLQQASGFPDLNKQLLRIQNELFNLGAELAMLVTEEQPESPCITNENISQLEKEIDQRHQVLKPLTSFILPGGSQAAAQLHVCRTVARRAERRLVHLAEQETIRPVSQQYLNRLSDWLFVMARWVLHQQQQTEVYWQP